MLLALPLKVAVAFALLLAVVEGLRRMARQPRNMVHRGLTLVVPAFWLLALMPCMAAAFGVLMERLAQFLLVPKLVNKSLVIQGAWVVLPSASLQGAQL